MNEKLLNAYWQLLIVLLMGDLIVGSLWLLRYNILVRSLKNDLMEKLNTSYGVDVDFQVGIGRAPASTAKSC